MCDKRDNIYIYLWEELNTIYIGRTVNPKNRHWAHKHRENETTYKFCVEHGVEHPKMVIIENNLTTQEGAEREKYWIKKYREENEYFVLNKSNGGEISLLSGLTDEEYEKQKEEALKKRKNYLMEYKRLHKMEISEKAKVYREKNKEKIKDSYVKNKDKHHLRVKAYTEVHKEEIALYQKEYAKNNRDRLSEYKKLWYQLHKDEIKENGKIYRDINKDIIMARKKEYREKNKEKIALHNKEYYENNKEEIALKRKIYVEKNKEKIAKYKKEWYENHKSNK